MEALATQRDEPLPPLDGFVLNDPITRGPIYFHILPKEEVFDHELNLRRALPTPCLPSVKSSSVPRFTVTAAVTDPRLD